MITIKLTDRATINRPSRRDVVDAIAKVQSGVEEFAILEGNGDLFQFTNGHPGRFHANYADSSGRVFEAIPDKTESELRDIAYVYVEGGDWKEMSQWSEMEVVPADNSTLKFQMWMLGVGAVVVLLMWLFA